jgi:hypothetical protein
VDVSCPGGNPSFTDTNRIVGFARFTINRVTSHPREVEISL